LNLTLPVAVNLNRFAAAFFVLRFIKFPKNEKARSQHAIKARTLEQVAT